MFLSVSIFSNAHEPILITPSGTVIFSAPLIPIKAKSAIEITGEPIVFEGISMFVSEPKYAVIVDCPCDILNS